MDNVEEIVKQEVAIHRCLHDHYQAWKIVLSVVFCIMIYYYHYFYFNVVLRLGVLAGRLWWHFEQGRYCFTQLLFDT